MPRYPQDQRYHDFADQRRLLPGIPNTMDVLSNAPFVLIGIAGLVLLVTSSPAIAPHERAATIGFFLGTILTGIGSAIYHLDPRDATLALDRLGMTVAFMSFVAMVVQERLDAPSWLLPLLLFIGAASVVWWRLHDDLRFYGLVQFVPILLVLVLVPTTRARYTHGTTAMLLVIAAYAVAKVCEHYDRALFRATRHVVSGHTLKHLAAALAPLVVLVWIAIRR